MKANVIWKGGLNFESTTESGRSMMLSGNGEHMSPMELVLQAVGGCSSIDIVMILQKARQSVEHCECVLTAERATTDPKVFTKIHAHYLVSGEALSEKQVARACELSMEKYCSVSLMLKGRVTVTHSFEIVE
ncbi:MAG: OsmC family protein [Gammaproteobacteria bacterium]|nr:OsmC family protein [Gammaproteobacteria bacterium]NVK88054.1 OsmC family protein [Gammaproteobacteria bacterium]